MKTDFKFIKGNSVITHTHEGDYHVLLMSPPAVGTEMHIYGVDDYKGIDIHGYVHHVVTTFSSPTETMHQIYLA